EHHAPKERTRRHSRSVCRDALPRGEPHQGWFGSDQLDRAPPQPGSGLRLLCARPYFDVAVRQPRLDLLFVSTLRVSLGSKTADAEDFRAAASPAPLGEEGVASFDLPKQVRPFLLVFELPLHARPGRRAESPSQDIPWLASAFLIISASS